MRGRRHAEPAAPGGRWCATRVALLVRVEALAKGTRRAQYPLRASESIPKGLRPKGLAKAAFGEMFLANMAPVLKDTGSQRVLDDLLQRFPVDPARPRNRLCKLKMHPKNRVTQDRDEIKGSIDRV